MANSRFIFLVNIEFPPIKKKKKKKKYQPSLPATGSGDLFPAFRRFPEISTSVLFTFLDYD